MAAVEGRIRQIPSTGATTKISQFDGEGGGGGDARLLQYACSVGPANRCFVATFRGKSDPTANYFYFGDESADVTTKRSRDVEEDQPALAATAIDEVEQLSNNVRRALQCPVCMELACSITNVCSNGHSVCDECAHRIFELDPFGPKCPICRSLIFREHLRPDRMAARNVYTGARYRSGGYRSAGYRSGRYENGNRSGYNGSRHVFSGRGGSSYGTDGFGNGNRNYRNYGVGGYSIGGGFGDDNRGGYGDGDYGSGRYGSGGYGSDSYGIGGYDSDSYRIGGFGNSNRGRYVNSNYGGYGVGGYGNGGYGSVGYGSGDYGNGGYGSSGYGSDVNSGGFYDGNVDSMGNVYGRSLGVRSFALMPRPLPSIAKLHTMMNAIRLTCLNRANGCLNTIPVNATAFHDLLCTHSPGVRCLVVACSWTGSYTAVYSHVFYTHTYAAYDVEVMYKISS